MFTKANMFYLLNILTLIMRKRIDNMLFGNSIIVLFFNSHEAFVFLSFFEKEAQVEFKL